MSVPAGDRAVPLVSHCGAQHCSRNRLQPNCLVESCCADWTVRKMRGKYFVPSCRQLRDGVRPCDLFPASVTQLKSLYFTSFSLLFFIFPLSITVHPPTSFLFSLFPPHSVHREWRFGSHVTFCLNTIAGVCHWPFFFERALVSRVTGNGGTTSLFSAAAPPLPSALL